jgi:hypothetical protein
VSVALEQGLQSKQAHFDSLCAEVLIRDTVPHIVSFGSHEDELGGPFEHPPELPYVGDDLPSLLSSMRAAK